MSAVAIYTIITICNSANLNECRPLLGFSDYRAGYTAKICREATAQNVDAWLKANNPTWFISRVRCGIHEERGA